MAVRVGEVEEEGVCGGETLGVRLGVCVGLTLGVPVTVLLGVAVGVAESEGVEEELGVKGMDTSVRAASQLTTPPPVGISVRRSLYPKQGA